jgi:hypothetical protein
MERLMIKKERLLPSMEFNPFLPEIISKINELVDAYNDMKIAGVPGFDTEELEK